MNNWKTSLAAIAYGLGKCLQTYQHGPSWLFLVGQILEYVAIGGGFVVAKDFNTHPKP